MMENKLLDNELLIQHRIDLESLELWKLAKDIDESNKRNELYYMKQTSINIERCFKILEQGQSITAQLEDIRIDTEDFWYNEECDKSIVDVPITDLIKLLKLFRFSNYQEELAYFVKRNVDWRKKDRDFEIYEKIRNNTLYSEVAIELDLTIPAISKINKKVQSSINNLKGRLFEIEYEKYLKSLDNFRNYRIVRDGAPGKPDIYIKTKKRELFVLSLKNLELNKDLYAIVKEKLKPELEFAYYKSTFEKFNKVELYLIVFDSLAEKLYVNELDFRNPSNVNIYH